MIKFMEGQQNILKSYKWILMKFCVQISTMLRKLTGRSNVKSHSMVNRTFQTFIDGFQLNFVSIQLSC